MLGKFGKFPFEHFTWGQALLYYNHVSTVSKDHILGKAWEPHLAMLATGKKCLAKFVKKWLLQKHAGGGKFFASSSTTIRNGTLACSDPWAPSMDCSTVVGNGS